MSTRTSNYVPYGVMVWEMVKLWNKLLSDLLRQESLCRTTIGEKDQHKRYSSLPKNTIQHQKNVDLIIQRLKACMPDFKNCVCLIPEYANIAIIGAVTAGPQVPCHALDSVHKATVFESADYVAG